ncbi:arsenic metallochaperone ArsD family protein, partial [Escherichia coli]
SGAEGLPLLLLDGETVMAGRYPKRAELARWFGIPLEKVGLASTSCCGGKTSCC